MTDGDEGIGTVCAIDFCVFCDLRTRKTSGGVNLKVTQGLVRCQRPRVVHVGANSCVG
jgi:hypothetical protein